MERLGADPRRSPAATRPAAISSARLRATLANTVYRAARSKVERRAIFALRHRTFLADGAIEPRPDALLTDEYEDLPNAHLIGVYVEGLLAASIRLHVVAGGFDDGSPALDSFPDVLRPMLREGLGLADATFFVVDRALTARWPHLPYLTLRAPFIATDWLGMDIVTATVCREHAPLCCRVLRMTPQAEPRCCPGLRGRLRLLTMDYLEEDANVLRRYPFFAARPREARGMLS